MTHATNELGQSDLVCLLGELWKTSEWIWRPFGVVSGVSWQISVLDGDHIPQGRFILFLSVF